VWLWATFALCACRSPAQPAPQVAECVAAADEERADALAVCRRVHDATGDPEALATLALLHLRRGNDHEVLRLASRWKVGPHAARLARLAGDAALSLGRRDDAKRWYAAAVADRDDDLRRGALAAARLADLELADGDLDGLFAHLGLALELAGRARDPDVDRVVTLELIDILLRLGNGRSAEAAIDASAASAQAVPWAHARHLLATADLRALQGRPAAARAAFEACIALSEAQGADADPRTLARSRLELAGLRLRDGDRAGARADLDAAAGALAAARQISGHDPDLDATVEHLRILLGADEDPAGALRAWSTLWRNDRLGAAARARIGLAFGKALAAAGRFDDADDILEQSAGAIEALRDGYNLRETRRGMASELRAPYEALFTLRTRRGDAAGAVRAMERALARDFADRLLAEHDDPGGRAVALAATLDEARSRSGARVRLERAAVDADRRAPRSTPAVGFFSAEGTMWRIAFAAGVPRLAPIGATAEIEARIAAAAGAPRGADAVALRRALVPDDVLPAEGVAMVFVPDRALRGLAFAALWDGERFLAERNPTSVVPSLSLAQVLDRPSGNVPPAVVIGDPTGDLHGARDEATAVATVLGVDALVGAAADDRALTTARSAGVLHVASHAEVSDDGSFLRLANRRIGAADILGADVAPRVAVLASCASAVQRPDAMWTSVAAAFLATGTRHVVGALRSIDDDQVRDLLVDFYRFGGADDPIGGLARAQRAAIGRGVPVETWASLVVLGLPSPP